MHNLRRKADRKPDSLLQRTTTANYGRTENYKKISTQNSVKVQLNECIPEEIQHSTRDVKRLSVYRLSFIFLVLVFEFQKSIIVSNLGLSS